MSTILHEPWISFVAVVFLLVANGFFVAAEFALVKARGVRVQKLADEGQPLARLTLRIQHNLEAYLAACQLGITMASLGLGWVGEPAVAALLEPTFEAAGLSQATLHTVSFLTGFLIFSSLHIVIGEQVPKTYAIRRAEPVSLACAYPLHAFYLACFPLNWALNRASRAILTAMRVEESSHVEVLTIDEFRSLIDVSAQHGELEEGRAVMLHNLFQFDVRPVERIMVPRRDVDYLDVGRSREENIRVVRETTHSRLPVVDGDWTNLLGLVLVKDILGAMLQEGEDPWEQLRALARQPVMVPESQRVARLFETMRAERAHMAFVLDEYGEFVGLVTLEDLIEEIVGEIEDELDEDERSFSLTPLERGWKAHGLAPLTDVERVTGFRPHAVDANTLSGLFMQRLERMPEVGDEILEAGFRLRVTGMRDRYVHSCELVAESDAEDAAGDPAPAADEGEAGRSGPASGTDA